MLNTLLQDLKQAQLDRDELKVSALRMLISEIKNASINKGPEGEISDDEVFSVIQKELKKRNEAALAFKNGGREELALKEESEAGIFKKYLPEQLSDEELSTIIDSAITETGASTMADMGKVIGLVMGKAQGKAEGSRVSALVKERLLK